MFSRKDMWPLYSDHLEKYHAGRMWNSYKP
jgi:hypothetical protein